MPARAGLKSLVLIPDGKIAWGKLSQAMDSPSGDLPVEGRLRRLPDAADADCE